MPIWKSLLLKKNCLCDLLAQSSLRESLCILTAQRTEWGLRIYKRTPMQIFFVAPRYILLLSLKWYLARCPWICFGFEPQRWVHFEGFSTGIRNSLMNNWVGWWVGGWKNRKGRVEQQMEFYL